MITIIAPSLDDKRIYAVDELHAGSVHRSEDVLRHASGKGSNAARTAAALGHEVQLCAPAGEEMQGLLRRQLGGAGVLLDLTATRLPTRSCITVVEHAGRATELVQEALPLDADEAARFRDAAFAHCRRAEILLLAGSLPPGLDADFYQQCARRAHGAKVLIDAQGAPLLHALKERPYCVKINREEVARSLGREVDAAHTAEAAGHLQRLGAQRVIITDGASAVHFIDADGMHQTLKPPAIRTVNPVGSGDAMSGALAAALAQGDSFQDAVSAAVAAGAANAATLLPGDVDAAQVAALRGTMDMRGGR